MSSSVGSGSLLQLFGVRRIMLSAMIDVEYLFWPSSVSHDRVSRRPSMCTFFHLERYFSASSARCAHAVTRWNSAFSCLFPASSFHLIDVATEKDATFFPLGVSLISGSAVRFPRISTLLIELIIRWLLIFWFVWSCLVALWGFDQTSLLSVFLMSRPECSGKIVSFCLQSMRRSVYSLNFSFVSLLFDSRYSRSPLFPPAYMLRSLLFYSS